MQEVQDALKAVVKDLFNVEVDAVLTRPDEQFGDYATNVALQLAQKLNKNPREIASELAKAIHSKAIAKTDVAGPGFINIWLTDEQLVKQASEQKVARPLKGKVMVAEYSDPNPFKVLHAGHLYTSVVGDAVANLLESAGATVHRVNYGGDVGLHVAKTMWAIIKKLGGEKLDELSKIPVNNRAEWLAEQYIAGNAAYDNDKKVDGEIVELNKRLYQIVADKDHTSPLAHIYWTTRQWSYDYFDDFYARIGTKFEKYYPESEVVELGLSTVNEQLNKGVFERSDGAIIFNGEKFGLHTRVFINGKGLPTYETKEVGLILTKYKDYHFDGSVIITANEIAQYMQVVLKAIEQFAPELVKATNHLTHGLVKLKGGQKMSSREGNILRADDVLAAAAEANQKSSGKHDKDVELGAVKYAFLKNRTGGDIMYDPIESVSLEGNSGPYLQYAHARARSIISKSPKLQNPNSVATPLRAVFSQQADSLQNGERSLVRKIGEYAEVVDRAVGELMPHHICTYLYELAQTFNRFYENNRVIGDERESFRLQLVQNYADTLQNGLGILGITAPEKM